MSSPRRSRRASTPQRSHAASASTVSGHRRHEANLGTEAFLQADPATQVSVVLDDFNAAYRLLESGSLDKYSGQFVAVLNGQVIGAGPDSVDLRMQVSQSHQVHPERVAVIHIFDEAIV